jgi:hypothetical protein
VAKANELDVELVETKPTEGVSTEFLKLNKLGKIPTFEGADGYVLSECIAIAVYRKLNFMPSYVVHPNKRTPTFMMRHFYSVIPV